MGLAGCPAETEPPNRKKSLGKEVRFQLLKQSTPKGRCLYCKGMICCVFVGEGGRHRLKKSPRTGRESMMSKQPWGKHSPLCSLMNAHGCCCSTHRQAGAQPTPQKARQSRNSICDSPGVYLPLAILTPTEPAQV